MRRPPISTLFPYRRSSDLFHLAPGAVGLETPLEHPLRLFLASRNEADHEEERSEEHTSELQSRPHLVCRLLLEKRKPGPAGFLGRGASTDIRQRIPLGKPY